MEIKKVDIDPDKDILFPKVIIQDRGKLFFERHTDNPNKATDRDEFLGTWSVRYGFDNIKLIQDSPDALTMIFDDFGHIHLEGEEQIKGFIKSLNWLYNEYYIPYYDSKKISRKIKNKWYMFKRMCHKW